MKKVLVIDDTKVNQESAKSQLTQLVELTVVGTFHGAMQALKNYDFDVVLTDVMLPVGITGHSVVRDSMQLQASGLAIALYATGNNIPVCIVTDLSHHHSDPMSLSVSYLENLGGNIRCLRHENGKDWRQALELVMDGPFNEIPVEEMQGTLVFTEDIFSKKFFQEKYPNAVIEKLDSDSAKTVLRLRPGNLIIVSSLIDGVSGKEFVADVLSVSDINQKCTITNFLFKDGKPAGPNPFLDNLLKEYRFEMTDIFF